MTPLIEQQIVVDSARIVAIRLAALKTGLTETAIRRKMDSGAWLEGREYFKAPDGQRYVDMEAYEQWVRRKV